MCGCAVRHMDLPGPFRIIGESAAGEGFSGSTGTAEAVRIFTGAAVPEGADTVIMQENCPREGNTLRLTTKPPAPGPDTRARGSAFDAHDLPVARLSWLKAAAIALALRARHGTDP